jgi:hypothetical protein
VGRRGYPPEFRRKVLDLVEAGRPVVDVAAGSRDQRGVDLVELLDRRRWEARIELANAIFEYLETGTTGARAAAPWAGSPR